MCAREKITVNPDSSLVLLDLIAALKSPVPQLWAKTAQLNLDALQQKPLANSLKH